MTLHFVYVAADQGTDVVRLGTIAGLTTQAEAGNSPTSSIEIDDPAGSLDYIGLKRFYVTETACPSGKQMLWNGYIRARRVKRGDAKRGSLRTAASRMWTVDLVDVNSLLDRDIIQGTDTAGHGHRPAETDVARITWLIGSSFMNHIHDNGLFSTANPVSMDACDYRGQYGGDVLRDCSVQTGKNFFAYYDEASGQDSLFYDNPDSSAYDSGKFLSNVLTEIDDTTTFGLLDDWELARDPSKVYAGALVPFSGGTTYRYSAAVAAAFYTRDGTAPNPNISTLAKAQAAGDRFIADSATEDDRLTGRIKIPAAHVNDIYAGMLVTFKATHLPGYESGKVCRVVTRSVAQDEESDQFYNVHLELSPVAAPGFVQFGLDLGSGGNRACIFPSVVTEGDIILAFLNTTGSPVTVPPAPVHPDATFTLQGVVHNINNTGNDPGHGGWQPMDIAVYSATVTHAWATNTGVIGSGVFAGAPFNTVGAGYTPSGSGWNTGIICVELKNVTLSGAVWGATGPHLTANPGTWSASGTAAATSMLLALDWFTILSYGSGGTATGSGTAISAGDALGYVMGSNGRQYHWLGYTIGAGTLTITGGQSMPLDGSIVGLADGTFAIILPGL